MWKPIKSHDGERIEEVSVLIDACQLLMEEDNSDEIKFISSQTYIIEQILSKLPECIETRWQEKMDSEDCFSEL